jgi:hypothetical protein
MSMSPNTKRVLNQKYSVALLGFADSHEEHFGPVIATDIREAASIIAGKTVEGTWRSALVDRLQKHVDAIGCLIGHTAKDIASWRWTVCSLAMHVRNP